MSDKATADLAKKVILTCLAEGMTVEKACAQAGKSVKTYDYYRRSDKNFADLADRTRLGAKNKSSHRLMSTILASPSSVNGSNPLLPPLS